MRKYLIFVDTNILLDFYRVRHESGLELLSSFDALHGRLITTYQVEMEFKRNRQAVIAESLRNLKGRDKLTAAAFLAETRSAEAVNKTLSSVNKRVEGLRDRLRKVLADPTRHDPVYKIAQRLFTNGSPLNLDRQKKERQILKRSAFRRFILGYPPRKQNDTSMGDALNWEWIIHVAKTTGDDVVIVSRDSDYGLELEGQSYINDWLVQEFRDRVSLKRQLRLFNRLSPALKLAKVVVTKQAEQHEEEELAATREAAPQPKLWPEVGGSGWVKDFESILRTSKPAGQPPPEN